MKPNTCIVGKTMRLTTTQLEALRMARDYGPSKVGKRGTGARMCNRLVDEGLMTGPPYNITLAGRLALKQRGM